MSTSTLTPAAGDFDGFDEDAAFLAITGRFDDELAERPRFVKSRTEILSVGDAIDRSLGRRRHRTREREV